MSKRWSYDEDMFLAAYFDAIGDYIGVHDLGRPRGAATKRVQKLKETGAWDCLQLSIRCRSAYNTALGIRLFGTDTGDISADRRTIAYAQSFFGGPQMRVVKSA